MFIPSPRNYLCIQRVEMGVVLSNNYYVVPRFLASLHLGLSYQTSQDFTPSFLVVNPSVPFTLSIPQTYEV